MNNDKQTLADRIRDIIDLLGDLLTPKQPSPQPIPVRHNEERRRR